MGRLAIEKIVILLDYFVFSIKMRVKMSAFLHFFNRN
jgi:hypothetical protein